MGARPWLSVVMPTYNGERFVRAALESVAAQGADGFELLVVDDGSTDRTAEIVQAFAARLPLRRVSHAPGGNWVAATNAGLRAATGKYACLLHQDDVWLPGRLSRVHATIAGAPPGVRLFVHAARFVGPDGEPLGTWRCPLREGIVASDDFVGRLLVQNFIAIPSPVFETAHALDTGGLDESLWYTADWDLWLRLGAAGPVRYLPEPLAAFRVHPESQTAARPTTFDAMRAQMTTVVDRHLPRWPVQGARRRRLERISAFSAELNAALAARARGQPAPRPGTLVARMLGLGPRGMREYLRDSRILERAWPRVRLIRRTAARASSTTT